MAKYLPNSSWNFNTKIQRFSLFSNFPNSVNIWARKVFFFKTGQNYARNWLVCYQWATQAKMHTLSAKLVELDGIGRKWGISIRRVHSPPWIFMTTSLIPTSLSQIWAPIKKCKNLRDYLKRALTWCVFELQKWRSYQNGEEFGQKFIEPIKVPVHIT